MTINVTEAHIRLAIKSTLECPVLLAALDAGLNAQMVGVGTEHPHSEIPAARLYLTHNNESIIQPLPAHLIPVLKTYDRTGVMEPLSFDIPFNL